MIRLKVLIHMIYIFYLLTLSISIPRIYFPLFCKKIARLGRHRHKVKMIIFHSHVDIEDGEVDPELAVSHLAHVDQVLLATGVRPRAHIGHLMIRLLSDFDKILMIFDKIW